MVEMRVRKIAIGVTVFLSFYSFVTLALIVSRDGPGPEESQVEKIETPEKAERPEIKRIEGNGKETVYSRI